MTGVEIKWERGYYKDGTLNWEIPFVNDKQHGVQKGYYEDGTLHWEIFFFNGQAHGTAKWYYEGGMSQNGHGKVLYYEVPYLNGQQHGIQKGYHEDGILQYEILWIRGEERSDLLGDKHRLERLMLLGEQV